MNLTTRKIVRGNSLIMKFLGVKPDETGWCNGWELQEKGLPFSPGAMGNGLYNPPFHKDWNWLMAVVEKIDGIGFDVQISRISVKISRILENDKPIVSLVCGNISKKNELLFQAIVEFIKWYNENKD